MSEADLELMRRALETFSRNERDETWKMWAEDGTANAPKEWPEVASREGLNEVKAVFDSFDEAFGPEWPKDLTVTRLEDVGDGRVLVEYDWKASGASSGLAVNQQVAAVYTVKEGKISHGDFFMSHEEGRAAAGLE